MKQSTPKKTKSNSRAKQSAVKNEPITQAKSLKLLKQLQAKPARQPRLPFLHKKRYAIPLLAAAIIAILVLVSLPLLPQVQSAAQSYTVKHPAVAHIVPKSFQPPDLGVPSTGNWLVIPKASVKLPIVEGDSIDVLVKNIGVWHQTGQLGNNYVIAGHRLQYNRTVNQSLYHLNLLQPGDRGIYVVINGLQHEYQVTSSQVVDKTDVQILNPSASPMLTIYTCNDFFNHSRLTVMATPIAED